MTAGENLRIGALNSSQSSQLLYYFAGVIILGKEHERITFFWIAGLLCYNCDQIQWHI